MARPDKCRLVGQAPRARIFKPAGIPARKLESVEIGLDEFEAVRLADLQGLYFDAAGAQMGLSRATFGRLVARARHKIADAIVHGKMLTLRGGHIKMKGIRVFLCESCQKPFEEPCGTGRPRACPHCGGDAFHRTDCPGDNGGEHESERAGRHHEEHHGQDRHEHAHRSQCRRRRRHASTNSASGAQPE